MEEFGWPSGTDAAANLTTTAEGIIHLTGGGGTVTAANLTQTGFTAVLLAINTGGVTAATGDDAVIVMVANDGGGLQAGVYLYTENGTVANNVTADELTLLGVVTSTGGTPVAANFIFG